MGAQTVAIELRCELQHIVNVVPVQETKESKATHVQAGRGADGVLEVVRKSVQSLSCAALEIKVIRRIIPLPVEPGLVNPPVVQEEQWVVRAPSLTTNTARTSSLRTGSSKISEG